MKARLENGRLIRQSNPIRVGKRIIANPSEATLAKYGYKEVVETEMPMEEEGYYFVPSWVDEGESIVRVWEKVAIVEEESDGLDA